LPGTNPLAYFAAASATKKKVFKKFAKKDGTPTKPQMRAQYGQPYAIEDLFYGQPDKGVT
jgi:hypothetical protein